MEEDFLIWKEGICCQRKRRRKGVNSRFFYDGKCLIFGEERGIGSLYTEKSICAWRNHSSREDVVEVHRDSLNGSPRDKWRAIRYRNEEPCSLLSDWYRKSDALLDQIEPQRLRWESPLFDFQPQRCQEPTSAHPSTLWRIDRHIARVSRIKGFSEWQ
jgi:hypothetical protein